MKADLWAVAKQGTPWVEPLDAGAAVPYGMAIFRRAPAEMQPEDQRTPLQGPGWRAYFLPWILPLRRGQRGFSQRRGLQRADPAPCLRLAEPAARPDPAGP